MKKLFMPSSHKKLALITGLSMALICPAKAQNNLEFDVNSYPSAPTGPSTSSVSATMRLYNGSTFSSFSPAITATAQFTSQQYTGIANSTTGTGLMFGGNSNSSGTAVGSDPVWYSFNTISTPSNSHFTGNPYGTAGTGIDVSTNYAFNCWSAVRPLQTAGASNSGRHLYGVMTITFNRPICNPVMHIVGLGGSTTSGGTTLGFATELDLTTSGVTMTKLSGSTYLAVSSTSITNNATTITATSSTGAATGSIRVTGNNITTLTFNVYVRGDGKGSTWEGASQASGDKWLMSFSLSEPTISGNVYNDADGMVDNTVDGTAYTTTGLHVNLYNPTTGLVAGTTPVQADGSYLFQDIIPGSYPKSYSLRLSTTAGTVGSAPPANNVPTGYVHTGTNLGTGTGGSNTSGTLSTGITLSSGTTVLKNANFGIEQIPVVTNYSAARQSNPGGTTQVVVPFVTYSGSDAEDGAYTAKLTGKKVTLYAATNGTLYYKGVAVSTSTTDNSFDPTQVSMDPAGTTATTAVSTSFTYAVYDAADMPSTAKTVTMPVDGSLALSGTVWDDMNGDAAPGSESVTNAGGLNAVLTDNSGNVIETVAVNGSGVYTFTRATSSESYKVLLSTTTPTTGDAFSTSSLPTSASGNWVHTGVNLSSTASTANKTGIISITMPGSGSLANQNFGIEQTPVADIKSFTAPANAFTKNASITIGGNPSYGIVSNNAALTGSAMKCLSGTDVEDCATASTCNVGKSFIVNTINANTRLYYNFGAGSVPVSASTTITGFSPASLTIYGQQGQGYSAPTALGFTYSLIDGAGVTSSPVTYALQTSGTPLPIHLQSFGGAVSGCTATLSWKAATETDGDYYQLEQSANGLQFHEVAKIACRNSAGGNTYSAKADGLTATTYFRLKRVMLSGDFDYTEVLKLQATGCAEGAVSVSPNPAKDHIVINGLSGDNTLLLYNSMGSLVYKADISQSSTTIHVASFAPGTYLLQVISANGSTLTTTRLIKE